MRPSKTERIALIGRVLADVAPTPEGFLSETGLADVLGVDPRRLRALRDAGIVAPKRIGRTYVYDRTQARTSSIAMALTRLELGLPEITGFLSEAGSCPACRDGERDCTAADCCMALLDGASRRVGRELDGRRRLVGSLAVHVEPAP